MATKNSGILIPSKKTARTKQTIKAGDSAIPVFKLPVKSIVDARQFIPVFDFSTKAGNEPLVVRKEDLFPQANGEAIDAFALQYRFGQNLLDTFTPGYGSRFESGNGYFAFVYSDVKFTSLQGWDFEISDEHNRNNELSVSFFDNPGTSNIYILKLNFLLAYASFILTIKTGGSISNVFVGSGTRALNIFIISSGEGPIPNCDLILDRSLNTPPVYYLTISSVELYNSLFLPPPAITTHF